MKQKGATPAPARELYTSPLFRGRRRHVVETCDRWFVLSARYGLVDPSTVLAPYDESLTGASASRRRKWADDVLRSLDGVVANHSDVVYEIHAGATYRSYGLVDGLRRRGAGVDIPAEGLSQGEQLAFYARGVNTPKDRSPRLGSSAPPDLVVSLTAHLSDHANAHPAARFPVDAAAANLPGLYSWWCDDAGQQMLGSVLHATLPELIYAGQAGATTRQSGIERSATLASRIGVNHLRGNVSSSTFRRTLAALLIGPLDLVLDRPGSLDPASNERLSDWMRTHLRVAIASYPDRSVLAAAESEVLRRLDPPLNLMGMPETPIRRRLTELRQGLSGSSRGNTVTIAQRQPDPPTPTAAEPPEAPIGPANGSSTGILDLVRQAVQPGDVIHTLSTQSPNRIEAVGWDGVQVSTPSSDAKGSGPQLVPMWMIERVWNHLVASQRVTQQFILSADGLNVKRSAFVTSLIARFDGVHVVATRPTELEYRPSLPS